MGFLPIDIEYSHVSVLSSRLDNMQKSLSDLLGAHSIDNWVEDGWDEEIKVGQKNMDVGRHMTAKAMGER